MKNIFLSALLFTAPALAAQAGSLNFDFRGDYSSKTYENSTLPNSSRFNIGTGRLDYQGKALEDLSFRLRLSFTKNTTQIATDSTQQAVELAFLTHKISDNFSLSLGKMFSEIGGYEGAASSPDRYLLSEAFSSNSPLGSFAGTMYGSSQMQYLSGAKASLKMDGQTLHVVAFNEKNEEAASSTTFKQNTMLMGASWKGNFLNDSLGLTASYHVMNGNAKDEKYQWMAVGAMWSADPVTFVVDYLANDHSVDGTTVSKDQLNSVIAKVAYTGLEQWTPRLEFSSSELKTEIASVATRKWTGVGAVVEFTPSTDAKFRYHVAYTNVKEMPTAGNDITLQEVFVGTRISADFLK